MALTVGNASTAGLVNIGNTCFLNAVIQSLSTIRSFHKFLKNSSSTLGSAPGDQLRNCLLKDLENLEKKQSFEPSTAHNALLQKKFPTHEQQDAHEFMQYLLSIISEVSEEVNVTTKPLFDFSKTLDSKPKQPWFQRLQLSQLKEPNLKNSDSDQALSHNFFGRNIRDNPFVGMLRSTLECPCKCDKCIKTSPSYQKFIDLSLSIPEHYIKYPELGNPKLEECLALFTETEEIFDMKCESCRSCESCRTCRQSIKGPFRKKLTIVRSPETLCLHIRRLVGHGGPLMKVRHFVDFPLELDMAPYCSFSSLRYTSSLVNSFLNHIPETSSSSSISSPAKSSSSTMKTTGKSSQHTNKSTIVGGTHDFVHPVIKEDARLPKGKVPMGTPISPSSSPSTPSTDSSKLIYELVSVIVHHGTHNQGHYTVYKRQLESKPIYGNSSWYHISDSHVRRVNVDQVLKAEAYMLYYEKKSK